MNKTGLENAEQMKADKMKSSPDLTAQNLFIAIHQSDINAESRMQNMKDGDKIYKQDMHISAQSIFNHIRSAEENILNGSEQL